MKSKIIDIVLSVTSFILTLLVLVLIKNINVLPDRYFLSIIVVLFFINLLCILLLCLNNKIIKVIGYIFITILIILNCIACYYLKSTDNFLNKSFTNIINKYTTTYYVISKDKEDIKEVENLGYYKEIPNIDKALNKLKEFDLNKKEYKDLNELMNKENTILIEKNLYNLVFKLDKNIKKQDYKIIYKFDIETEEKINTEKKDDVFNIYIGGTDFTYQFYDFNMIVTVNKKTNQILLTSIPRDYHINVYGKGAEDNLGYIGVWGINTTIKSLEELLNIKIDYYIKIETNSLVQLVDLLDGIEYCSDEEYTTTHSMILDSYNDSVGNKLYVKKGCKKYNGIETLTIARERLKVTGGDSKRQQNCQKILISIFNKIKTINNLTKYNELLDSVNNLYTTNMPKEVVTKLIKDELNSKNKWNIETQILSGFGRSGYVHLSNYVDYITVPNMDSVKEATTNIQNLTK